MLPSVWGTRSPQPVFGGSVCVTAASTREVRPQELAQMEQVERGLRGVKGREPATVCLAGWTPLFTKPAQAWLRLASPRLQVGTAPPGAAASGDSAALLEVPSKRPHLGSARVRRVCWVADTCRHVGSGHVSEEDAAWGIASSSSGHVGACSRQPRDMQ